MSKKKAMFFKQASGGIATEYQTYLDRLTTLTYTQPTAPTQVLQNQLVLDLKTAGVWNKADVISLFATDGDSDSSLVNLYPPASFQNVTSGTITFTSKQGWNSDGTTGQIMAAYNTSSDATNFTQNNNCAIAYYPNGIIGNKYVLGSYDAAIPSGYHVGTGLATRNNSSVSVSSAGTLTGTMLGMRRNDNANVQLIDDAPTTIVSITSSAIPNKNMSWIGRDGSASGLPSDIVSFGYVGSYLNDAEIAALKIALDTYYTNLNT